MYWMLGRQWRARLASFLLSGNSRVCAGQGDGEADSWQTETVDCRILIKVIKKMKCGNTSKRDWDRLVPWAGDQGRLL